VALACFGTAAVAAVALIAVLASGTIFGGDEWGILFRVADQPLSEAVFDPPAGKYLLVVPTLIYAALAEVLGTDSYVPFRVVGIVLDVLAAGLFLEFARRRVGYGLAVGGAILLLFFGAASDVIAVPGRVPSQVAICAGLGMLLALDRKDRRGDIASCVLCAVAVTSHPVGLAFLAACLTRILLDDRARALTRSWVFLIPLALYALWYATLRDSLESASPTFSDVVSFASDAFVAVCGALTGVFRTPWTTHIDFINGWSTLVAIVVVVVGAVVTARDRRITPGLAAALVALGVNLIGPVLAPGGLNIFRQPTAPRYLYPGAIFVLMVVAELLRGRTIEVRFRPLALALAVLLFASAMYSNVASMVDRTRALGSNGELLRTEFGALEQARKGVGGRLPDGLPTPKQSAKALVFTAGPVGAPPDQIVRTSPAYFAITDEFGSPASTRAQLTHASNALIQRADLVLATALGVELEPDGSAPARRESGACRTLDPEVAVPPGRVRVGGGTSPPRLRLGRLAEDASYGLGWPSGERDASLSLPRAGLGNMPWRLLDSSKGDTRVCY
jgi:hypothetical protein